MLSARQYHTATLLPDGCVLVVGGDNNGVGLTSAELYDPVTETWTPAGSLSGGRTIHSATLLPDGRVLVAGGMSSVNASGALSSAELYDPAIRSWSVAGTLSAARDSQTATLLPNGQVLMAAGYNPGAGTWLTSAELYDSAPGPIRLLNPARLPSGGLQFTFTGAPQMGYAALVGASPLLPDPTLFGWHYLGVVPEFSPGLFVFSGPSPTPSPAAFYRVIQRLDVTLEDLPCLQAGSGLNPCPNCMACNGELWFQFATCREPCPPSDGW
jgi:hypothetical protein